MRSLKFMVLAGTVLGVFIVACGSSDPPPAAPTAPTASVPGAPGTDPYGAYYPPCTMAGQTNCTPPAAGAPTAYPTAAPTATAPMATPGALALPCTSDSACILARCNTQYGKCAYPCQTAADCATGATCNAMSGLCLPGG